MLKKQKGQTHYLNYELRTLIPLCLGLLFLLDCSCGSEKFEQLTEAELWKLGLSSTTIQDPQYLDYLINYSNQFAKTNKLHKDTVFLDFVLNQNKDSTVIHLNDLVSKEIVSNVKTDSFRYLYYRNISNGQSMTFEGSITNKLRFFSFPIKKDVIVNGPLYLGFENDTLKKLRYDIWTPQNIGDISDFLSTKYGKPNYATKYFKENGDVKVNIQIWLINYHEIALVQEDNVIGPHGQRLSIQYNELKLRLEEELQLSKEKSDLKISDSLNNKLQEEKAKKAVNNF